MTDLFRPIEILRPARLEFGAGLAPVVGSWAAERGLRRILVVAGRSNAGRVDLLALPGEVTVFGAAKPEPDIPNLLAAIALAEQVKPDLVIGFGGGSALDLAKLVAVLPGSGQSLHDVVGPEKVAGRRVALVQVPTTAGTGSEAGTRALVTDPATQAKLAVQSRHMLADLAVVDPDLMLSVPPAITAATGVDALAHCAEAFTSRKAHPLIDLYALEGIRLVGRYLPRAVRDGADREARAGLALASLYGGYCLGPVNTTAGHAVAYPLGTRHHIAHGLACAVIFPHTLAFNAPAAPEKTALTLDALGTRDAHAWCASLGIEMRLSRLGVPEHDLPTMAQDAHAIRRLLDNNPRDMSAADILDLYPEGLLTMSIATIERPEILAPMAGDPGRQACFLPTPCIQNHAAFLATLPGGDLGCVWFGGTQEGVPDIFVHFCRLAPGATRWSDPQKLSDDPTRSEQNPLLFTAPNGDLWLLWTAQIAGHQDTAIIRRRISTDGGQSWGPVGTLIEQPGYFIRQPIMVLPNGDWLLPTWLCPTPPAGAWRGDEDTSVVLISADQGATWVAHDVPGSTGCVHMNILALNDGTLLALYRSRWADSIYASRSANGRDWSVPEATELPNNNSSIQAVRLANGHIALAYNHASAADATGRRLSLYDDIGGDLPAETPADTRAAFWGAPRAPMTIAISDDGGRTWPHRRDVETGDGFCMTNNSKQKLNRELSYPSIMQTDDGAIHLAYTHFRQAIRYVRLSEDWVKRAP